MTTLKYGRCQHSLLVLVFVWLWHQACAQHAPNCGVLQLTWCTVWLGWCTPHWLCNCSFGYRKSLVAGYKHTLTKARVIIMKLEAGKVVCRCMKVYLPHGLMICNWVMFGKIISMVGIPGHQNMWYYPCWTQSWIQ